MRITALCIALLLGAPTISHAQQAADGKPQADSKPQSAETKAPVPEGKRAKVIFLDSKMFDGQLSKELGAENDTVEVDILGKISLNRIPERMDRWISLVAEKGSVNIKAADQGLKPKFIFDLVQMVYAGVQHNNEERMLEPAHKYDATIFYSIDSTGESKIEKIVFVKRKQAPAAAATTQAQSQ